MEEARRGKITEEMKIVAEVEDLTPEKIRQGIAQGRIIIPKNVRRDIKIIGIGEGLTTKVNVNVGTSTTHADLNLEIEKTKVALQYGTDTIMDLSTGGNLDQIRRKLLEIAKIPFGTVPIYQAGIIAVEKHGALIHMDEDIIFNTIEKHFKDGVDFITVHTGITKELAEKLVKSNRIAGIVSRGGTILAAWMLYNNKENPLYENYDYLLELAEEYDATLSLGDALRPGSILDAHDTLQISELINNARLTERAWNRNVQVMIEGPGHMTLDKVAVDVRLEKSLTNGAPYYVLGPLVTDTALGYDHIASAIGAAIAAAEGADLICYLTPAEHLSLPDVNQVKEGLIASKIAAHAGDLIKLGEKARKMDLEVSKARANLDWSKMISLSLDPERSMRIRRQFGTPTSCTMCGSLCVYLILEKYAKKGR